MTEMTDEEAWAPVRVYEGLYAVSNLGRLKRISRSGQRSDDGIRRSWVDDHGYRAVSLYRDGRAKHARLHLLMCEAFHGPKPPGEDVQVRHLDGNRLNNRPDNLAWGSRSQNTMDSVRHGSHNQASKTHCLRGHEFTPENTYHRSDGRRNCRACAAAAARDR